VSRTTLAFASAVLLCPLWGCSGGATPGPDAPVPISTMDGGADTPVADAPSGPKAPDFSLPTLAGNNISLSDFEGNTVVLIDFWSTTCDPCLAEMPELVKLYNEKKAKGFEILAISTDGPETRSAVSSTVKKLGMIFPILLDEETEVMDRYNPKGELPMTIVVDKNGTIVLKRASYQPGDTKSWNALVAAVDGALAR
jgi:peroxiredoxin